MSDFWKFMDIIIFFSQHIGVCGLVMVSLAFIVNIKSKRPFLYSIVIIILFILTIRLGLLLHSFGIIMCSLMFAFTLFVDHITYRFGLTYFMWLGLLCTLAVILGLIGKYVLYGNALQLFYAVVTTILLMMFSITIGDRFLQMRVKHGEIWKMGDTFLFLATTLGIFCGLYPSLFFIN